MSPDAWIEAAKRRAPIIVTHDGVRRSAKLLHWRPSRARVEYPTGGHATVRPDRIELAPTQPPQ